MIIINGTINENAKDIKSKLEEINSLNISMEKMNPTKRLDWKLWSGKNNNPEIKPNRIDKDASLKLIFLLINP